MSQQWLAQLDHQYDKAALAALQRARQYDDASGYRDYLSLLHVLGQSEAAWAGFARLMSRYPTAHVWYSALVGHGRAGAAEKNVREWLSRPETRAAQYQGVRFAPYYAVLWSSLDHAVSSDLGAFVETLEGDVSARVADDGVRTILRGEGSEKTIAEFQPSPLRRGKAARLPAGTPVKSKLAYFAAGLAALHRGDFAGASSLSDLIVRNA